MEDGPKSLTMQPIQLTIDETLLAEVDRVVLELHTTRSAFIWEAAEAALHHHNLQKSEQQHAKGYRQQPAGQDEFAAWVDEQQWGQE